MMIRLAALALCAVQTAAFAAPAAFAPAVLPARPALQVPAHPTRRKASPPLFSDECAPRREGHENSKVSRAGRGCGRRVHAAVGVRPAQRPAPAVLRSARVPSQARLDLLGP
jgi:hypothetical protein